MGFQTSGRHTPKKRKPGSGKDPAALPDLAHWERWVTLGRLAGASAHEIKTPLAVVRLHAKILETLAASWEDPTPDGPLRSRILESVRAVQSAADRMLAHVESIRRYGRPPDETAEEWGVRAIVQSALDLLAPRLKGIRVETDRIDAELTIRTERLLLEQTLVNLIANAADAYRTARRRGDGRIRISARARGGFLRIEVADGAGGIPAEIARRLFREPCTTKGGDEGTGLGLLIARESVNALGGDLSFRTKPGEGATFTVSLPVSEPPSSGEPP